MAVLAAILTLNFYLKLMSYKDKLHKFLKVNLSKLLLKCIDIKLK